MEQSVGWQLKNLTVVSDNMNLPQPIKTFTVVDKVGD